jgi:V-type H+-transporting ATPase subunit a
MGDWFRSQSMSYVTLIVSADASKVIIRELGTLGCIEFVDLQSKLTAFQRPYTPLLKRFDDIENKIRFLAGELHKNEVVVVPMGSPESFLGLNSSSSPGVDLSTTTDDLDADAMTTGMHIVEGLESKVNTFVDQMTELNQFNKNLHDEYMRKIEFQHLLILSNSLSRKVRSGMHSNLAAGVDTDKESLLDGEERGGIEMAPMSSFRGPGYTSDDENEAGEIAFSSIAGTIRLADRSRFERQLYRSTRGNCFVRFGSLDNKAMRKQHDMEELSTRVGFIIFFKSATIERKITRICDSFSCHMYIIPPSKEAASKKQYENEADLLESRTVLAKCKDKQIDLCRSLSGLLEGWLWVVKREKGCYDALNLCRQEGLGGSFLQAKGWIPDNMMTRTQEVIEQAHKKHNLPHMTTLLERVPGAWPTAPTHFRLDKFTYAFQEFVNTYGVPRYREINPALFTAGTFPFLFGVMYGDIGHGTCLTLGALFLLMTAEKALGQRGLDPMVKAIYSARYMLLMMGLCALYCGMVYNDYFSLTIDVFGSSYQWPMYPESALDEHGGVADSSRRVLESSNSSKLVIPEGEAAELIGGYGVAEDVYPFGVDPVWHIAGNDLLFFNSMKMKMAVVLGVIHMSLGIGLKGVNAALFKQPLDLYLEFIPQVLFTLCLFGYMIVLIFMKWAINWDDRMQLGTCNYDAAGNAASCTLGGTDADGNVVSSCYTSGGAVCDASTSLEDKCPLDYGGTGDGCQPPNLISTLMNIALKPGDVQEPMFFGQAQLQVFLLLAAFICIPWMLCLKPYLLIRQHKQAHGDPSRATARETESLMRREGGGATENPLLSEHNGSSAGLMASASGDSGDAEGGEDHGEEEHSDSEIVIHQAIETIEFVLGMISNTASYLRLWALSLAHSELAHVFWEKALLIPIKSYNPVFIVIGFYVFAAVTAGVLLGMDLLECFLHALRLHWVEFQNKFYKADGFRFRPLSFREILEESTLD